MSLRILEIPSEQWYMLFTDPVGFLKIARYLAFGKSDALLCDSNVMAKHERHKLELTAS